MSQSADRIELWFGSGQLKVPPTRYDIQRSIAVWLERGHVVGLGMGYSSLVIAYPVEAIELSATSLT